MLTCFSLAEKAHAKRKNKNGMEANGKSVPIILNPEWKSPIPNDRNSLPIILSAQTAESKIPATVPAVTTARKRNAKDSRSLPVDKPIPELHSH